MALDNDRKDFLYVTKNNPEATKFLMDFFHACHVWDDLIDKDVARSDEHINHAFWIFMVEIPRNPWYNRHFLDLHPIIMNAIQEWFAANKLEKNGRQDIAYTLRCSIVSVVHQTAYLCGGYEWAVEIGDHIREMAQAETYDEYLGDLNAGLGNGS